MLFSRVAISFFNRVYSQNRIRRYQADPLEVRINNLVEMATAIEPSLKSVLIPERITADDLD
jgi:hypothetical protein